MLLIITSCLFLSLLFAPLGCILLWQKKSFFADGLAHSSLLAASVSAALNIHPLITAPCVAGVFTIIVFVAQKNLSSNNAINLVSNSILALSIIIASIFQAKVNLNHLLIGDVLSIDYEGVIILAVLSMCTFILLYMKLNSLVIISLNKDLAKSRGINTRLLELFFMIFLSLVLTVGMKIIGALLSSALLIIPAAASYLISRTPLHMISFSVLISIISGLIGLAISFYFDLPTAPCIILGCSLTYITILSLKSRIS